MGAWIGGYMYQKPNPEGTEIPWDRKDYRPKSLCGNRPEGA